jgi:hypothetical protein
VHRNHSKFKFEFEIKRFEKVKEFVKGKGFSFLVFLFGPKLGRWPSQSNQFSPPRHPCVAHFIPGRLFVAAPQSVQLAQSDFVFPLFFIFNGFCPGSKQNRMEQESAPSMIHREKIPI